MKILAIETSCDETAAAVVESGRRILSSVIHSQVQEHAVYGGVVPEIASRRHIEQITQVVEQALADAGETLYSIDAVAVTAGPGLVGALLVGVNFAKGLSAALKKPLIPVHHIRGHIASNYLSYAELQPPFLCLVVSGGHSHIINVLGYTAFDVLGRTRDDAAGETFDKVARAMGLGYPGGLALDRLARNGDPTKYRLPKASIEGRPLDMSFSGVKTAAVNLLHNAQQKGEVVDLPSLAASLEDTVCEALVLRLCLACEQTGIKTITAAGGVSANTRLRELLTLLAGQLSVQVFLPDISLTGDNAAMIGAQAYYEYLDGNVADEKLNAVATLSVEKGRFSDFCV